MFRRLKSAVSAVLLGTLTRVFGWYEGARRGSIGRSYIPEFMRDARMDIMAMERWELQRKSRYFEKNNPIYNKLADLFEQYVVGTGLVMSPASSNDDWNTRAAKEWQGWQKFCNLSGPQSFNQLQSIIARAWFVDGECFVIIRPGKSRIPRIQVIEAHRVGTPPGQQAILPGNAIYDGIEVDAATGRPVAYWLQTDSEIGKYDRFTSDEVIHVFEPGRPFQYRGIPFVHPCMNDLHDMDDLQLLEQKAAREAAELSNVITTSTGELPSVSDLRRQRFSVTGQKADGTTVTEDRAEYVQRHIGGRTVALKTGEEIKQFKSDRPSVATQWYWDYLTAKVCIGVGISKMLVMPWSIQGTIARGIFDGDAAFFKARWSVLSEHLSRIYEAWVKWAVYNVPALYDPPSDYYVVRSRPPRTVNVDIGRNSTAMLAELHAGATTLDQIYSEQGLDWREQMKQRAAEVKLAHELAKEFSTPDNEIMPGEICSAIAEAVSKSKPVSAPAPETAEPGEPKEKEEVEV